MARISAAQKVKVRQALLSSAAKHFAAHGLAGANINRISIDAGYAKGTVYNYFPSKEALFAAVLASGSAHTLDRYRASSPPADVRGRLLALVQADVAVSMEHEDFMKAIVRELVADRPQTRALLDESLAPLLAEAVLIIAEGQADGSIRADRPAPQLAMMLMGQLTMGYISNWRTDGAWPTFTELPALTVDFFFDGAAR